MAPTEKSPGRLVGKINWRINEVGFNHSVGGDAWPIPSGKLTVRY